MAAVSKISIISEAFLLLGNPRPLNTLDELNQQSDTAAASKIYDTLYRELLSLHPWRFALKTAQLNLEVDPPEQDEWQNMYQLPPDILLLIRTRPLIFAYEIFQDKLVTNESPEIKIDYVFDKPEENMLPALFVEALTNVLAGKIGNFVTQNVNIAKFWLEEGAGLLAKAKYLDAQSMPSQGFQSNPMFDSHFGLGTFANFRRR